MSFRILFHFPAGFVALAMLAGGPIATRAEESPPPGEAPKPPPATVEKTGDSTFKIGAVSFDSKTREITFPAWVNMREGQIEFPVVHRNGRTHEAIFATDIFPLHLETALRLLRYKTSSEVFPTFPGVDPKHPPAKWPEPVFAAAEPASHLQVFASWGDGPEKEKSADVRTLVYNIFVPSDESKPRKETRFESVAPYWVFTGSTEPLAEPVASLGGSIVGIRNEEGCSINTLGSKEIQAADWFADTNRIPPLDTPVVIHIRPASPAEPVPASAAPKP